MSKAVPFQNRLIRWSLLVAVVSLVLCVCGAAWFVYHQQIRSLKARLKVEADNFYGQLAAHGGRKFDWNKIDTEIREWLPRQGQPRLMKLWKDGEPMYSKEDALLDSFPLGLVTTTIGNKPYLVQVTEEEGVRLALAVDDSSAGKMVRRVTLSMLCGFPLSLGFAWLGSLTLARMAVKPIQNMTQALDHISAKELDQRVPVQQVEDDISLHARSLNTMLERLERSYDQALRFSADASHELKTPLTVMRAIIEATLDSPDLSDHNKTAVAKLLEQTLKLSDITSSLLLLARADAGKLRLLLSPHDLTEILEAALEDTRIEAEAEGVRLVCQLIQPAMTMLDPQRFAQILSNLLSNALKYNCPQGSIVVTLHQFTTDWHLEIANTGPGIPVELQPSLFRRFFRAAHTAEKQGYGLGLGLARELAQAHGGSLTLKSSDAGWTKFLLVLPKSQMES